jgi:hypothetical protein
VSSACRTLLIAGVLLWSFGALVALRIGGTSTALAWAAASPVCVVVGIVAFLLVAKRIDGDPKQTTKLMMALPMLRMVAAGLLGWLVVGLLPMEAQGPFWVCLVAAYLATLTVETGLLAQLVRRAATARSNDVKGAV